MTQNDIGPGLNRNYGERDVFAFCRKVFFWPRMGFNPKNHPKFLKRLIFIWEKATFSFEHFFLGVARTWCFLRSESFFWGPKSRFLAKKSDFCNTTPILINDPFLALGVMVHFPPWDRFFDFPFQSYSSFHKKNLVDPSKSLPRARAGKTKLIILC